MTPDSAQWTLFLTATLVLLAVPGPSVIYVVTQAVEHGSRGALLASVGLALGDLLQALLTAAGLAALLASSAASFHIVKYAGAAYLVFLGIRRSLTTDKVAVPSCTSDGPRGQTFPLVAQAFLALNPKTTLFFFALFPQIVDATSPAAWVEMLVFGCVFTLIGFVTNFLFGSIGGKIVSRFVADGRFRSSTKYLTATTLVVLGLIAAFGER
jgi:threonine/homoserine/homoserine lactone efflux protein